MRYLTIFLFTILLAGCATAPITVVSDKYHVIVAPDSLYKCPTVKSFPKIETLTDLETARLLVQYAENNQICKSSLNAVRQFYIDAKAKFER